jgi:hypothetical protein
MDSRKIFLSNTKRPKLDLVALPKGPKPIALITRPPKPEPAAPKSEPAAPKPASNYVYDNERDDALFSIKRWDQKKPLLITGLNGSGKSCTIKHLYESAEFYDDQDIDDFLCKSGLRTRGPAVIDPIDGIESKEREAIKNVLDKPRNFRPLILISDDVFSDTCKTWKKKCIHVHLDQPSKAFVRRVLSTMHLGESDSRDLASAIFSAQIKSKSVQDNPMDIFKATRLMSEGRKVQCLGGSADTAFLSTLMQLNAPMASTMSTLPKIMDLYSSFDLMESRHVFDGESLWSYMEQGATLNKASQNFTFQWPKPTAKKNVASWETASFAK